jgi:nitrogen regulatory protein PII
MSEYPKKIKITIVVNRALSNAIIDELNSAGINKIYVEAGRTTVIEEKEGLFSFLSGKKLGDDPVEIISFFIREDLEEKILNLISIKFDFKTPGRGTIFSNEIQWIKSHDLCLENSVVNFVSNEKTYMFNELKGICCIVQRGEGDNIAKIALETGSSVPITTYGIGGGVRDKLGLLRITIPAEKELINLIMSAYDIDSVMEMMIAEGKLDEPGKGFTYVYPVKQGIVNTKISRGKTGQAASMEQVVSAIDGIKGGMEWRKSRFESETSKKRFFLTNLVELALVCNEGYSISLMKTAMEAGASGSTISKLKYRSNVSEKDKIPATREKCKMIVSKEQIPAIAEAIEKAGGFGDDMHGLIYSLPAPKAFTYIAKK